LFAGLAARDERFNGSTELSAILVVPLAIKAAFAHGDLWPASVALTMIGAAAIWLAYLRKRDERALAGGLALQLAATFLVWQRFLGQPLDQWGAYLIQTNAVVAALIAAGWLRLRARWSDSRWCW